MNHLDFYPEQASRFATTRPDHDRVRANMRRRSDEIGTAAAAAAVEELVAGRPAVAADIMADCLLRQMDNEKIRRLEVVS